MTKAEALRLMAMLRAAWPRQEIGEDTTEVYAGMLADLSYADAKTAVTTLVKTSKWFPTIAEIREQAADAKRAGMRRDPLSNEEFFLRLLGDGSER